MTYIRRTKRAPILPVGSLGRSYDLALGRDVSPPKAPRAPRTVKNAQPERAIQRSCIAYLRAVLPPGSIVAAIENERHLPGMTDEQRMRYGAQRKASGVVSGAPDVFCALPGGVTVWLEVKAPAGRVSDAQTALHSRLHALDHTVEIVRSIEDCRAVMVAAGVTLRDVP